jgi:cytidyltransferase-like protein
MDKVVVISGFFNPLHCGHLDYIQSARLLGSKLIVIVNNDLQVELKGSRPFMNEEDRLRIVQNIKGVDTAVLSIDKNSSVCQSVRAEFYKLQDNVFFDRMIFANGGDRKKGGVPEDILEAELGITMAYNVGGEKTQSSSELLDKNIPPQHNLYRDGFRRKNLD